MSWLGSRARTATPKPAMHAGDIYKALFNKDDVPEEMKARRHTVVQNLKSLQASTCWLPARHLPALACVASTAVRQLAQCSGCSNVRARELEEQGQRCYPHLCRARWSRWWPS